MKKIRLGIIGCGGIAHEVAAFVEKELSTYLSIAALYDIDSARAAELKKNIQRKTVTVYSSISQVVEDCDLILETAVGDIVRELLNLCIRYKKDVILLSIGGIFSCEDLFAAIKKSGICVYHPSGAIAGVDGVYAASLSNIRKLTLTTSKPPTGLGTEVDKPEILFEGSPREAYRRYPRNINVAATLFLASNYENMNVVIKVDPALKRNIHIIELESSIANMRIELENKPLPSNPKTSALAAASTNALLAKMFSPIKIGI